MPHDSMRIFSEKVMFLEISTSSDRPVPLTDMYTHPSATRATHQTKKHRLSDDNHLLIGTQMSSPKSKSRLELGFQQFLHLFCQLEVHRKMEKQIVQVHHKKVGIKNANLATLDTTHGAKVKKKSEMDFTMRSLTLPAQAVYYYDYRQ